MAYQPAGNLSTSPGLAHLASVYYKKRGLDRLQKKFVFNDACMPDVIPKQSGRTVQWYRYSNFSTNTTPSTEGTVSTSLALGSHILGATVSQYTAFVTVSDIAEQTALDPIVVNATDLLGYSGGLSTDTITRAVIDAESSSTNQSLLGTFTRVADLRATRSILQALDVKPMADGQFLAIMHPYCSYDLVNDPAAGGLADILKYNSNVEKSPLIRYEDRGLVTNVAGFKVIESTNVKITSGSPNTYRTYLFGENGVGSVDLEGRGPSKIKDPSKQRFNVNVIKGTPSIADPEGVIAAAVSYNFVFCAVVMDGPAGIGGTYRYRTIDAASSIG